MARITVSECPNCGAPVSTTALVNPDAPACPFCHALLPVEAAAPAAPPVGQFVFTPMRAPTPQYGPRPALRRRRRHLGWIVPLLVVGLIFGIQALAHSAQQNNSDSGSYQIEGLPALASASVTSKDAFVVAPEDGASGSPVVREVDLKAEKTVWSSAALRSYGDTSPALVAGDGVVVAIFGAHIDGLAASSGAKKWTATLTNPLAGSCSQCAAVVGADLVTIAEDGVVTGFDLASGHQLWSEHLSDQPNALEQAAGDVVVDSSVGSGVNDLLFFDAATGAERKIEPECAPDGQGDEARATNDSPFYFNSSGTQVTVLIDGSGGCVASYAVAGGSLVWRTAPDAENSKVPFTMTGESSVSGGGVIAWTNEIGSNTWIFDVSLSGGPVRQLYEVGSQTGTTNLDGIAGQSLILDYAPVYNSEQPAIYAVSLASGLQAWMHRSFVASADDFNSQTVVTTAGAVVVVYCASTPDDTNGICRFHQFNPASGANTDNLNVDDIGPAPTFTYQAEPDYFVANLNSDLVTLYSPAAGNGIGWWPST